MNEPILEYLNESFDSECTKDSEEIHDEIKRVDIKEFREKGYLQELNRRFLHPLGLALEVIADDNGCEKLGGIWDYRNDEEGLHYDIVNSDIIRQESFKSKKEFIDKQLEYRYKMRKRILGYEIEPINL